MHILCNSDSIYKKIIIIIIIKDIKLQKLNKKNVQDFFSLFKVLKLYVLELRFNKEKEKIVYDWNWILMDTIFVWTKVTTKLQILIKIVYHRFATAIALSTLSMFQTCAGIQSATRDKVQVFLHTVGKCV